MLLTYKKMLLLISGCCMAFALRAQTRTEHNIAGFVCTRGTSVRVAKVLVTNIKTNTVVLTDDLGTFTIKAAVGDTLEFAKQEFTTVQLPVTGLADLVIFLQKVTNLAEVTIVGQTKQQEVNSVMTDYRKKGVYYGGKPSAISAITSPLNGLYSLFGKEPKNARHFAAISQKDLEAAQDSKKYNKSIVKKVTNLPDEELQKFMDAYTPSHQDLLKWNDYEVINYIKKSLADYKKYGVTPMQKLY
jgi:hypothetical protein